MSYSNPRGAMYFPYESPLERGGITSFKLRQKDGLAELQASWPAYTTTYRSNSEQISA